MGQDARDAGFKQADEALEGFDAGADGAVVSLLPELFGVSGIAIGPQDLEFVAQPPQTAGDWR